MDPYLEKHWGDVRSALVIYARDQLQAGLPRDLFARAEERVYVEKEGIRERGILPDVHVVETGRGGASGVIAEGDVAVAEPFVLRIDNEPITETFIEIREVGSGNRVVTVVEFLSPTNKLAGEGRRLYRKKQNELLSAKVSLVEIDLVRAGRSVFSIAPHEIPVHIRAPYHVVVRRGWDWTKAEIYPLSLRAALSAFRIPLRESDSDGVLNLQALIEQCYLNGRYDAIDYQEDCDPPLEGHDAEWADELLRTAGKRK